MQLAYKSLSSIFLLFFSLNLFSQDFDLIKIRSAYYPSQSIDDSSVDGEVGFFEWHGQVMIPQVFNNKKTILTHRVSYMRGVFERRSKFILGRTLGSRKKVLFFSGQSTKRGRGRGKGCPLKITFYFPPLF